MPSATSIVARSYPDQIIGIENKLPWHLRTDLQMFKHRTQGHAIIMGRKTYESIGRPLPNRINIILSRDIFEDDKKDNVYWAQNPETALLLADIHSIMLGKKQFFVIGGEVIYLTFYRYVNKAFITEVFCGNINGDAKFEENFFEIESDGKSKWVLKDEREFPKTDHDDYPFRVSCFMRRKPHHRFRSKEEFMGREPNFTNHFNQYTQDLENSEEQYQFDW